MRLSSLFLGVLSICALPASAQYGTLDITFDTDGIVQTDVTTNQNDVAKDLVIQPDGKIIAAGYTTGSIFNEFCLVRYNTDGSLDNTFGTSIYD